MTSLTENASISKSEVLSKNNLADHRDTRGVRFSTGYFTCCEAAARGAICRPLIRRGKPSIIISGRGGKAVGRRKPIKDCVGCYYTAVILREAIRRTAFAVTTERSRFTISGAELPVDETSLTVVATDGRKLIRLARMLETGKPFDPHWTVKNA